jgi:hypothetical protein
MAILGMAAWVDYRYYFFIFCILVNLAKIKAVLVFWGLDRRMNSMTKKT